LGKIKIPHPLKHPITYGCDHFVAIFDKKSGFSGYVKSFHSEALE